VSTQFRPPSVATVWASDSGFAMDEILTRRSAARPRTCILPLQTWRSLLISDSHRDGSIASVDPPSTNGNVAVVGTFPRVALVAESAQILEYAGACGLACHISYETGLYGNEVPLVESISTLTNE
jgi:hypothetical protein